MKKVVIYLAGKDWIELPEMTKAEADSLVENVENCVTNGIALRLIGNNLVSVINPAHIIKVVVS